MYLKLFSNSVNYILYISSLNEAFQTIQLFAQFCIQTIRTLKLVFISALLYRATIAITTIAIMTIYIRIASSINISLCLHATFH